MASLLKLWKSFVIFVRQYELEGVQLTLLQQGSDVDGVSSGI